MISDVDCIVSTVRENSFLSLAAVQDVLKSKLFLASMQHIQIYAVVSSSHCV